MTTGTATDIGTAYVTLVDGSSVRLIDSLTVEVPCTRCGGGGMFGPMSIRHGRCFDCGGAGSLGTESLMNAERKAVARVKARAARVRKIERERDAAAAAFVQWRLGREEFIAELLAQMDETGSGFMADMAARVRRSLVLTEHQEDAARHALAARAERKAAREATNAVAREAGHFGTVGEKFAPVEVEFTGLRSFDSDYGVRWLVSFRTHEGHVLKTWTSGKIVYALQEIEKGSKVTIAGTVKEHGEYNGTPETTVLRVKLV